MTGRLPGHPPGQPVGGICLEKPVHTLSFLFSYPQYRDYYLYCSSQRHPVWLAPEWFLGAGVLCAILSLLCRGGGAGGLVGNIAAVAAMVWVGLYFVVRLGWLMRVSHKTRRRWRQAMLGTRQTQIRLYDGYFTVHYPTFSFDGQYEEIQRVDHTHRLVIFHLANGAMMPVPHEQYAEQMSSFLRQRLDNPAAFGPF